MAEEEENNYKLKIFGKDEVTNTSWGQHGEGFTGRGTAR